MRGRTVRQGIQQRRLAPGPAAVPHCSACASPGATSSPASWSHQLRQWHPRCVLMTGSTMRQRFGDGHAVALEASRAAQTDPPAGNTASSVAASTSPASVTCSSSPSRCSCARSCRTVAGLRVEAADAGQAASARPRAARGPRAAASWPFLRNERRRRTASSRLSPRAPRASGAASVPVPPPTPIRARLRRSAAPACVASLVTMHVTHGLQRQLL